MIQPYIGYAYIIISFLSFFFMFIVFSIVSKDSDNFAEMGLICGVSPAIWPLTLPCFIVALFIALRKNKESRNDTIIESSPDEKDFAIENHNPWIVDRCRYDSWGDLRENNFHKENQK